MTVEGVKQRRVTTNGITLNIAERGEGPLVLLLPPLKSRPNLRSC